MQPMSVLFSVPEDALDKILPKIRDGAKLSAVAYDRANVKQLATGAVSVLDNQVDTTTGMVKLRANFDNSDEALFPNQFVNIRLLVDTLKDSVAAPTAAVQHGAPGDYAYVVADGKAAVRVLKLGQTDGDYVQILSGLAPGDVVVVDGADRLREGAEVRVVSDGSGPRRRRAKGRRWRASRTKRFKRSGFRFAAKTRQNANLEPDPTIGSNGPGARPPGGRVPVNVSEPFIRRPVATTLLMIAILLSGLMAYRFLPLATLPEVDYPTIQVQTFYPGASPEVMTSSVTAPLERQFGQMPGLNEMTSASSAGASIVTLQFGLSLSLDVAEQEVQAAINAATNLLPADLPAPPIYSKVNPADAPILTLAVTSKTLPLTELEDLSETRLAQKISQQPGVGLVSVAGGQRPAIRVQLNPTRARRLWTEHRRRPHHSRQRQRQHSQGQFRRAVAGLDHRTPTTRSPTPKASRRRSSPIATARRFGSATSPRSSAARRTASSRPGPTAPRRSSSMSSASRAPMSSPPWIRCASCCRSCWPTCRPRLMSRC